VPLSDDQMDALVSSKQEPLSDAQMDALHSSGSGGLAQKVMGYVSKGATALDSITGAPVRSAVVAAQQGQNPWSAYKSQFANMNDQAPSGTDIAKNMGASNQERDIYMNSPQGGEIRQKDIKGKSNAELGGMVYDQITNPLTYAGPIIDKAGKFIKPLVESLEDAPDAKMIQDAAGRLGFNATPGMTSGSETVQGLESSLSQSPSVPGAMVRSNLKPISSGLQNAAEDLVSGAPDATSAYQAGNSALKGVQAELGAKADNVKMAYENFNTELPKMVPAAEDKWALADDIAKIGDQHLDPNEVQGTVKGITNKIMGSQNLADIEETRKLLGNKISQAYSSNDRNMVDTLTKIKDKLSDFRDTQFQTLAQQAYPGPGGAQLGQQMVGEYQNAMAQHASLMNDLKEVGPIFGIKAKNPRDFIESFSEIPPEDVAKKLFKTNNYDALMKVQSYFPDEFETIKGLKLQELRNSSLSNPIDPLNSPVDPTKLVSKINKLTPEVQSVLFGDKAQKLNDMRTVLGSFPEKIGPSGTPKGEMFTHFADPMQQAADVARYGAYRFLGSKTGSKLINAVPNAIANMPASAAPASAAAINNLKGYSGGGEVKDDPPKPPPTSPIDPNAAIDVQASMRKAFHFKNGGQIPGKPNNGDKKLAWVSNGEIILPNSITQHSNAAEMAKQFVKNIQKGKK
jgi:hypothetical protein